MAARHPDEREPGRAAPSADGAAPEVMGVLEGDRLRAVVTTCPDEVVVTLEGDLDPSAAPVVDELLDAVERYVARADRRGSHVAGGEGPAAVGGRWAGASLTIDASAVGRLDPAALRVLTRHQARWRRRRGGAALVHRDGGARSGATPVVAAQSSKR